MIGSGLLLAALIAHAPTTVSGAMETGLAAPREGAGSAIVETGPPAGGGSIAGGAVQTQADQDDRMTVEVHIGGHGPYRFVVDTGAQNTIISTRVAGDLGLVPGPQVRVLSMGAAEHVATSRLESLEIGQHRFRDLVVPLLDAGHIGADGIVGTDSLQGRRVVMDFEQNRMIIGDPKAPTSKSASQNDSTSGYDITVHAKRRSGRLVMADAVIDGVRTAVVIDTGSTTTIGNLALQRAIQNRLWGTVTLKTATGDSVSAKVGLVDKLEMGRLAITNVLVAFTGGSVFTELGLDDKPAIFLGMREIRGFERIAIDFTKRSVQFAMKN